MFTAAYRSAYLSAPIPNLPHKVRIFNEDSRAPASSLISGEKLTSNFESATDIEVKTYRYDPDAPISPDMPKGWKLETYKPKNSESCEIPTLATKSGNFLRLNQVNGKILTAGMDGSELHRRFGTLTAIEKGELKGGMPLSAPSYINGDPKRVCYFNGDYPYKQWNYDGGWQEKRPEGELCAEPVTSANTRENTRKKHRHGHRRSEHTTQPEQGMTGGSINTNYEPSGISSSTPAYDNSSWQPAPAAESSIAYAPVGPTSYSYPPQYTAPISQSGTSHPSFGSSSYSSYPPQYSAPVAASSSANLSDTAAPGGNYNFGQAGSSAYHVPQDAVDHSLQSRNTLTERVHPDALANFRKSGANEASLSAIKSNILTTPRSRSPINHVLEDCRRHPHANRLDSLNAIASNFPGYNGIHTTIFTQEPSIENRQSSDIYSHEMFSSNNDARVTSVIHFNKNQGVIRQDGSYAPPWAETEHEIRHGFDEQKNIIATRMGKKTEDLNVSDLWQQDKAEQNAIESANVIAKRLGLPLQTTYNEFAVYVVDKFTDSLPKSKTKRKLILDASAELQGLNKRLLASASQYKERPEDVKDSDIAYQQYEALRECAEDLQMPD